MTNPTFENTYAKYPFAPLVEIALLLGRFIKEHIAKTSGHHTGADGVHGLSA